MAELCRTKGRAEEASAWERRAQQMETAGEPTPSPAPADAPRGPTDTRQQRARASRSASHQRTAKRTSAPSNVTFADASTSDPGDE